MELCGRGNVKRVLDFIGFPALVPIIHGTHPLNPAEALGKIAGGGEAEHAGDLGEGHAGL